MKKKELLINNIEQCNLSSEDKETLINLLKESNTDYSQFIIKLLEVLGAGKTCCELLEIDIGEFIQHIFK